MMMQKNDEPSRDECGVSLIAERFCGDLVFSCFVYVVEFVPSRTLGWFEVKSALPVSE